MKILHFSDTHVSHRRFRDVKEAWKKTNRVTWIEEDYCLGFQKALEIASDVECDYVIHSGDLFDTPVGRNLSGPSEYSRTFVIRELKKFFKKTENKIPLILIDGNHGSYLTRNYSTIEFLQAAFPDLIYASTNFQLKQAILENKPLIYKFDNVNFYLFPYFKFGRAPYLAENYENWMRNNQQPDPDKLSIAIAHGMVKGLDLHDLILQYPYDYVALGHDHKQRKIKNNAWQAGSTVKYTFAEKDNDSGVLEVQVQKGEDPIILPKSISIYREMVQFDFKLKSDTLPSSFKNDIEEKLKKFQGKFNGETAPRVKIKIEGTVLLTNWWEIEDFLVEKQKEVFSDDYNIIEFRWDSIDLEKRAPISLQKSAKIHEYLIEDPVIDFEKYIRSLGLEDEVQSDVIIEYGADLIKEVFSSSESEKKEGGY